MVDFIILFINMSGSEVSKLVLRKNLVRIDSKEFSIDEIVSILGEIKGYTMMHEFDEKSRKHEEKRVPHGYIKITFKNNVELTYETINPIVKVEDFVVKLNLSFREQGMKLLALKTSSIDKVVYQR